MNCHPLFQKTCLAALLLAASAAALAEQETGNQAVQVPVESQAPEPAVPVVQPAAVTPANPAADAPIIADDPAPAGSPAEIVEDTAAAGGGEVRAPVPETSGDQPLAGEPMIDTADPAGSSDNPTAATGQVAAIDPASLYGEWTVKEQHPEAGEVVTLFSINPDSSFAGTMSVAGKVVWNYSGNWYLEGNQITWFYTQSTPPLMLVDETEVDEIITVDGDKLVYRSGKRDVLETLYRAN